MCLCNCLRTGNLAMTSLPVLSQVELTKTRHDMISYEKKAELLNQKAQEVSASTYNVLLCIVFCARLSIFTVIISQGPYTEYSVLKI